MKKVSFILRVGFYLAMPIYVLLCFITALLVRVIPSQKPEKGKERLVWGSQPITNNIYWSRAMFQAGYASETFTLGYYVLANLRSDWDIILQEQYQLLPSCTKIFVAFLHALFRYDVFIIPCSGFFIGGTPLWRIQAGIFKLAKKKIVVIPYGGDSYIYHRISSTSTIHGLMMSYPDASRRQKQIAKQVDYWTKHADVVIPGGMGPDGFGRWDVLMPSSLSIDLDQWEPCSRKNQSDGTGEVVRIAHAPNHRGFKGTEFVVHAVEQLQNEGLHVELVLIEKIQNKDLRHKFQYEIDILVEQLIFTGHGLNALEGMASGLPVISNLEDDTYVLPFRRWSFLSECPLVSASPENLVDVLRKLVTRPKLRQQLGAAGRKYAEKYHGLDSAKYLFGEVIEYVYGRRESLINLYHPLLGEYPKRKPRVKHPLVNNRIGN